MKLAWVGVVLTMAITAVQAQTNTFPASGNVGIGTTSPAQRLQVIGATNLQGTTYIGQNTNGTAVIDAYNGNAYFGNNGTGAEYGISINPSGYVGIGTTGPKANLDVVGVSSSNPPSLSSVPALRVNAGGTLSIWVGNDYYTNMWLQAIQDDGSNVLKPLSLQPLGGYVGIGTGALNPQYSLDVTGAVRATSGFVFPDGTSQTTAFNATLCGGDYAESIDVTGNRTSYEPGDVLVIDPADPGKFLKANQPYSTLVAGIYSTKPGMIGRRQPAGAETRPDEVPMAMVGIVPTKVSAENGPIKAGDLLVASAMPGRAMRGTDRNLLTGAVLGKALGSLDSGTGVIEVLVTLQ